MLNQITVNELVERLSQNEDIFLLDVRTPEEYNQFNIEGHLIPIDQLSQRLSELPHDKVIVAYCRSGHRSQIAVEIMQKAGFSQVYNLLGGMLAWQGQVGTPSFNY